MASRPKSAASAPPAAEIASPAVRTAPKGKRTVTVACKFPNGLALQLCRRFDFQEQTMGGSRPTFRYDKVGPIHYVRGPAEPAGMAPKGYVRPKVEGGYALTTGIPEDFFDEWVKQNADSELVKNKLIFACATKDAATGEAEDMHETRTGFEPIVPDTDPRMPKSLTSGVGPIKTEVRGAQS